MSTLKNIEGNISLEINLLDNSNLDISSPNDSEKWIPFEFKLIVENEKYQYPSHIGACFSLCELNKMIQGFEHIANQKRQGLNFAKYEFHSCEAYFNIIVYDSLEENLIGLETWINMGSLTNGISHGYNKGFDFVVYVDSFITFIDSFEKQLLQFSKSIS